MVNPERIRQAITTIVVDENAPSGPYVHVDFYVLNKRKWYLSFDLEVRAFTSQIERVATRMPLPKAMERYLISILPPEILARCIAESIAYVPDPDIVW